MDKQAKQREKEDIRETKRIQKEVIKDLKRKEKEADALDVDKQYQKLVAQERLKEVKNQAKERLNKYKAIEQERLNPTREMKPLPINYIPYKRIQEVRSGENSRAYLGTNAMSLKKPLAPNVLDVAAMEREKELAAQRRKAGHKWVQVMIR
jgi:hypothetical protein